MSERLPAVEVLLDELLAEMRRHYEHATFANNIIIGGELRLRCRRCLRAPVPRAWVMRPLCEQCLDQANAAMS